MEFVQTQKFSNSTLFVFHDWRIRRVTEKKYDFSLHFCDRVVVYCTVPYNTKVFLKVEKFGWDRDWNEKSSTLFFFLQ